MTMHKSPKLNDHKPRLNGRIVPALDTGADDYLGVLYIRNDFRIAVFPGGRAYLAQFRNSEGRWNGPAYYDKSPLLPIVKSDGDAADAVAALPDMPAQHFLAESISALRRFVRSVAFSNVVQA